MRNISFALTTNQILDRTKTVTRRLGWEFVKVGDLLLPVRKCMGLKRGESLEVLCDPIMVTGKRREPLRSMTDDLNYGFDECVREGFGNHPIYRFPSEFVAFFIATHRKDRDGNPVTPDTLITRIEFTYDLSKTITGRER